MSYRDFIESKGGRFTDRETARQILTAKIAAQAALLDEDGNLRPRVFTSYPPAMLIADAEHRLRWIDCAPDGANHLVAPLQGDYGIPFSPVEEPTVRCPPRAVRDSIEERTGRPWLEVMLERWDARPDQTAR